MQAFLLDHCFAYVHIRCEAKFFNRMCFNRCYSKNVLNGTKAQNIVGIVTDRDIILRSIACDKDVKSTPVSEIMTCKVCSCTPDTHIDEAQDLMKKNQIRRIPVMENNKIVGILTLGDLAANPNINNEEVTNTLENICNCNKKNAE